MARELRPNISVRMFTDQKCFGPGLAELLRRVEEYRSLCACGDELFHEKFAFYYERPEC